MDRKQIVLRENWKFRLEEPGPLPDGQAQQAPQETQQAQEVHEYPRKEVWAAWYKGYDDSTWQNVTVPHDWSVRCPFSPQYSSGTGYVAGGIGWYRVHFTLPEEYRGKSVKVIFDGVYKNSQVWCNSYYLGRRPYGYSTFSYDITHAAAFGDTENVICVKVSHEDIADSRWFTGSGITRKVTLVVQEPVHPAEYGVFFQTGHIDIGDDAHGSAHGTGRAQILVKHRTEVSRGLPEPGLPGQDIPQQGISEQNGPQPDVSESGAPEKSAQELSAPEQSAQKPSVPKSSAPDRKDGSPEGQAEQDYVWIRSSLVDEEGETVLTMEGQAAVGGECTLSGTLEEAQLWSPERPYLYTLRTWYTLFGKESEEPKTLFGEGAEALSGGESKAYLADETKVGIRQIEFHSDRGFFLNGVETKLKGVCVHHDGGALGAAVKPEVWQRRLAILKECGCNAVRCSHNPHMPELYDLCDRMGFLMMDEAFDEWENAKNKWSRGHNVYPPVHQGYFEEFPQWHEADLRAMVGRDRNHPSVILWSIGNEVDYPNDPYCHPSFASMTGNNDANKPEAERRYDFAKPNALRLVTIAERLEKIVREEDPTRPVTLAAAFPELSAETGLFMGLDVVGYNYKEHLYEKDHGRYPRKPFLGSENSHSYRAWLAVRDNAYISGQFLWTGIDYLGETRVWPFRGSSAGLLTCAGHRKPEFHRRRAFWCQEPVIALAARRMSDGPESWRPTEGHWNYEEGEKVLVKVFSNLPAVRLLLNGQELGRLTEYNGDGEYCFQVDYEPGTLTAEGYVNSEGSVVSAGSAVSGGNAAWAEKAASGSGDCAKLSSARCSLVTAGEPEALDCQVWRQPDLLTGKSWEEASGEEGYLYQLEIRLLDGQGNPVEWQERILTVEVTGAGELAGLESGNLADVTPYSAQSRSTFHGRLLAFVRRRVRGAIQVKVSGIDFISFIRIQLCPPVDE